MTVEFFGRASSAGVEDVQEPLKEWLTKVLEAAAPESGFVAVLKAFVRYDEPMPRARAFASSLVSNEIVVEAFLPHSGDGLSYALYVPDGVNRSELVMALRSGATSFG